MWLHWVFIFSLSVSSSSFELGQELFTNAEFEQDFSGNWYVSNGQGLVTRSQDSHSGSWSAAVSDRSVPSHALRQKVNLPIPGGTIVISAYFKVLNDNPAAIMGHTPEISINYFDTAAGRNLKYQVVKLPRVWTHSGWVYAEGVISLPDDVTSIITFFNVGDDAAVDYLVDTASLRRYLDNDNMADFLNQRIDNLRKGPLDILVVTPEHYDSSKVKIEVNLTQHGFPFGAATESTPLYDEGNPVNEQYREYFFNLFNWATIANSLKWRFMETTEGSPFFGSVDKALGVLESHNVSVRGHCVSWGKSSKILNWLLKKDGAGIREAVSRRISYLTEHYSGRFGHWDVNNEDLHGTWYEESTNNAQFLESMLTELHEKDPQADLFLNDYEVLSKGVFTAAYRRLIMQLLTNNAPIHGIGVQSHLSYYPEWMLMESRLDLLASTGLPIWITELDVRQSDIGLRAQGYDDALRMYFSHPAVEGIVIWGIWDESLGDPNAMLLSGPDFIENAAGARVRQLLTEEWHTFESFTPELAVEMFNMRGFHGKYDVRVLYEGNLLYTHKLELLPDKEHYLVVTINSERRESGQGISVNVS